MYLLTAIAEWQVKGRARYGTVKFLGQTNCDIIDDNTCVSVDLVETMDDEGQKIRHK